LPVSLKSALKKPPLKWIAGVEAGVETGEFEEAGKFEETDEFEEVGEFEVMGKFEEAVVDEGVFDEGVFDEGVFDEVVFGETGAGGDEVLGLGAGLSVNMELRAALLG
jgi:hypothetical protein